MGREQPQVGSGGKRPEIGNKVRYDEENNPLVGDEAGGHIQERKTPLSPKAQERFLERICVF
jgi:hypothetical protein